MKKRGYQNKRVLITGASGFIGQNLIPKLVDRYQICVWDKNSGFDVFDMDLDKAIYDADIVIHLAALTSVNASFKKPEEFYRTNVLGTARVVELCTKYKKKLVYPSSAAVYHRELSPYADSKAQAEDIVTRFLKNRVTVLRFFNIYGQNMNKDSGSIMYNFLHDNPITIYGDGEQTRDYISVEDICDIIKAAISNKWNGKIVDCGTGQAYSANYVAGLFAHYRGVKIKYVAPKREIKWSVANTQWLESLYKKGLKTNLEKDIQKLCQS